MARLGVYLTWVVQEWIQVQLFSRYVGSAQPYLKLLDKNPNAACGPLVTAKHT